MGAAGGFETAAAGGSVGAGEAEVGIVAVFTDTGGPTGTTCVVIAVRLLAAGAAGAGADEGGGGLVTTVSRATVWASAWPVFPRPWADWNAVMARRVPGPKNLPLVSPVGILNPFAVSKACRLATSLPKAPAVNVALFIFQACHRPLVRAAGPHLLA